MRFFFSRYNSLILLAASIIWAIGMSYAASGKSMYLAPFVPIGVLVFYFTVIIKFFGRTKDEREARQASRNELLNRITGFETLLYYGFWMNIWVFSIILFLFMPKSVIHTYNTMTEHLEWNGTKEDLDKNPKLDSAFGILRKYSYPEWKNKDSVIRIAKVHTGGELAYGSFIYALDSNSQLVYIDSLIVGTE